MALPILPVIGAVTEIANKFIPDKGKRDEFQHDLMRAAGNRKSALTKGLMAIGLAEAQGTPYQRNWRPTLMYASTGLIIYLAAIAPIIQITTGLDLITPTQASFATVPEELWWVLGVGLGVFGAGRSIEKGVKAWANGNGTGNGK